MEAATTNEVVDKPMEERQREILRNAKVPLGKDMDVREVLRHMTTVFTVDDEEEIKSAGIRSVQCDTLIDKLLKKGARAYDIFLEALRKVNPHLVHVLNQAEQKVERQNSAGLEGRLQSLQTGVEEECKKNQKIVEEHDEYSTSLLGNLDEGVQSMAELDKEHQNSAVLGEQLRCLQVFLDEEKKRKEEIQKERDNLTMELHSLTDDNAVLRNKITSLENELKITTKKLGEELDKEHQNSAVLGEQLRCLQAFLDEEKKRKEEIQKERDKLTMELRSLTEDKADIRKTKTFVSSIFLPFGNGKPDVIAHLKKTKAKLGATRSSDGPGIAIDVLRNRKGPTCGTKEEKGSWWSIDLGEKNLLCVTHCALIHKRKDPTLTSWELQGSIDGHD